MTSPDDAVRALLTDSFDRIGELVESLTDGLDEHTAAFRPDPEANSMAWLIWHQSRVLDDHVSDLAGVEQVWVSNGWHERLGLPFDASDTGYGHSTEAVSAVRVDPGLLADYHAAVQQATSAYVEGVDAAELERVVDTHWDPPVTAGARLVSVIGDCLQHLGQAAYVRGLAERG